MILNKKFSALFLLVGSVNARGGRGDDDEPRFTRFEKFNSTTSQALLDKRFPDGNPWPLDLQSADILRTYSRSISLVLDEEVCSPTGVSLDTVREDLTSKNLYPVTHPEDEAFWEEFSEVVYVQDALKRKQQNECMTDPIRSVMPQMTQLWKGFGILDVAEAVHDEFPGLYHYQMLSGWVGRGEVEYDDKVVKKFGQYDFLRRQVMLSDMVGYAFRAVGPCNFSLKWSEGRARPEEVAFKLNTGKLSAPSGVDTSRLEEILSTFNMRDATDFTAYAEGSPTHPSWPAMHSASSASSFWLDVILDLNEEQKCEARMLDWSVSYARTVAGVHYPGDNISGLSVGQTVHAQLLPDFLNSVYGSDKAIVEEKMKGAMFDWTTFEDSKCFKDSKYKTVTPAKSNFCFDQRELPAEVDQSKYEL